MTTNTATQRRTGRAALAAFLWSLTVIPIGLWQLLDPATGPFSHELYEPTIRLPEAVPDWAGPAALIAAGVLGLLASRAARWAVPALFAVVFGVLMSTSAPMSFAGYLCALFIPLLIAASPVLLARGPVAKTVAGLVVAGLLVALGFSGVIDYAAAGDFLSMLGGTFADIAAYMLVQVWMTVGGGIWAALVLHLVLHGQSDRPAAAWLAPERAARWGRTAAWIAFACSLPYGLVRMSWLTPWAWVGGPLDSSMIDPATRVWGLCLGLAALGGGVLCLGMTYRWGTRWPFWMPGLKGRPVPPMVAIVPASVMAAMFTFMSLPFAALAIRQDAPELIWSFPFYVWGPALGAATLAYAIRRGVVQPS
ncbi:hypothetical protein [Glycomyces sp. NPDC047010]|uniref:hypothetical protein n=1 Tax=Glycomyces sp. NPDC047010 TaxID=3155023 RepID=UPI00340BA88C